MRSMTNRVDIMSWPRWFSLAGVFLITLLLLTLLEASVWSPTTTPQVSISLKTSGSALLYPVQIKEIMLPENKNSNYFGIPIPPHSVKNHLCSTINLWVKLSPNFTFDKVALPALFMADGHDPYFLAVSRQYIYFGMCKNCAGGGAMGSRAPIGSGNWHMLTGMLSTGTHTEWLIFLDGVLVGTNRSNMSLQVNDLRFIDVLAQESAEDVGISTREITLYDGCLSQQNIQAIYGQRSLAF